jgi:hypothetical protein
MIRVLVEIVAEYALFLERADDGTSLEAFVRQQEDLVAHLQRLDDDDRAAFLNLLAQVAASRKGEEREILERLPDDAGLRE